MVLLPLIFCHLAQALDLLMTDEKRGLKFCFEEEEMSKEREIWYNYKNSSDYLCIGVSAMRVCVWVTTIERERCIWNICTIYACMYFNDIRTQEFHC